MSQLLASAFQLAWLVLVARLQYGNLFQLEGLSILGSHN